LPQCGAIEVAIRLQNISAKVRTDLSQRWHARFNDLARGLIGINRNDTQLPESLGNGAFTAADTAGQTDNERF